MKRIVLKLSTLVIGLAACSGDPVQPTVAARIAAPTATVQAANRSIVEFAAAGRKDLEARVAALGGRVDFVVDNVGFAAVSGLSTAAASSLGRAPGISAVYDDIPMQLADPVRMGEATAADVSALSPTNPAGAFLFGLQWNMLAISAPAAWAAGNLGASTVTAAILDSGIDYDNLDLNGRVDLSRSTSFIPSDDAILTALFPTRNKLDDLGGHGTLVATQVASNGVIFAGVSSRTRLIGVKVLGQSGSGSLGAVLAGIVWAADHGADVANMSLGLTNGFDKAGNGLLVGLFNRVFNYANRAGMVMVVAAGNDARNLDGDGRVYSAFCESPHVICVSATGPTSGSPFTGPWGNVDAPANYSDFGKNEITVSAPGGSNNGFVSALCARHFAVIVGQSISFPCNVSLPSIVILGGAGTSLSAPHVTGVVAQLIAKYGKGKPSQIKQLLLNGVDDLGAPGNDPFYGWGRVNLAKAMAQ